MTEAPGAFWQRAQRDPSRIALIDAGGRRYSAGELHADANRISNVLGALGVAHGDRVAVAVRNNATFIRLYLAVTQIGAYLLTVNHHLTSDEIAYILDDSGAEAVICSHSVAQTVRTAADAAGIEAARVLVADSAAGPGTLDHAVSGAPPTPPAHRPAGGVMQYTSGTTGRPKGVRRPLPAQDADAAYERHRFQWVFDESGLSGAFDRWLVAAPLYHSANLLPATATLHSGGLLVLMDGWAPELLLRNIESHRITGTHLVPTHFHRLLALPEDVRRRYDLSSLVFVMHGAAPCPVRTKRDMLDWFGPVLYEYYGSTEVGSTFATPADWEAHPGTVGRALSRLTLKILDEAGGELAPGEVGTVYMRQAGDVTEYLNDPEKTAASRRGELITVGDRGYVDDEGFLYLAGRDVEMVLVGGVNVYPAEIEAVLLEHPAVHDAGVVGRPDDDLGEVPVAYVELDPTCSPDAVTEELRALCAGKLARHKHPQVFIVVEALPRDPSGKLYKRRLAG
jgi:long-chain acyl-CoA synthetase